MIHITYDIPDNLAEEFRAGFLKAVPVPLDNDGEPIMGDLAWAKEWGKQQFLEMYRKGKTRLAEEATEPEIDENVIQ